MGSVGLRCLLPRRIRDAVLSIGFDSHYRTRLRARLESVRPKGTWMAVSEVDQGQTGAGDPLRHHQHYSASTGSSPYAGGSSFMERVSEKVASGMGTVGFLLVSSAVIIGWILTNHVVHFLSNSWEGLLNGRGFDPAPFILLNLVFSAVAFYTGALVIIAQKAQTRTDKANEEASAKHRDELAGFQTSLLQKNTELTEQIHTLTERMKALTEEVHKATCAGHNAQAGEHGQPVGDG
jgi:uncharacterized membrane protein